MVSNFFLDLTNLGMVLETIGIFLVAKYGIPKNNDASIHDSVVITKSGKDLESAKTIIKAFIIRERVGFLLIGIGILLMLVDRNLA